MRQGIFTRRGKLMGHARNCFGRDAADLRCPSRSVLADFFGKFIETDSVIADESLIVELFADDDGRPSRCRV